MMTEEGERFTENERVFFEREKEMKMVIGGGRETLDFTFVFIICF